MKLSKQEQKYRAKQQLANKFTQKEQSLFKWCYCGLVEKDEKAVRKLVDKVCK